MVLSSNWLKLQAAQTSSGTPAKHVSKSKKKDSPNAAVQNVKKVSKPAKSTKSADVVSSRGNKNTTKGKGAKVPVRSKQNIMKMVNSMTEEINRLEDQKVKASKPGDSRALAVDLEQSLKADGEDRNSQRASEVGKYVSLDCEFVGVGPEGKDSVLARATVVNFFGHVVLDVLVKPQEKVTDWRTWVSGIRPQDMYKAVPFPVAQKQVAETLQDRILVGHAINHDLQALFLSHPRSMIRDTSRHIPFRKKYAGGKTPSLKKLAKEVLGVDIQGAEHSPIEDARATMLIYKADRKEFERLHKIKFGSNT
ncbi:LAFA_0E15038g1_1 [Lachancea sp. 'fantastica']|nr:LAFA_0E15038g1_1 [Lachancea sp. 'fantastica']